MTRGLDAAEIADLASECREALAGARVESVHQLDDATVVLTFYRRGAGKSFLLLSVRRSVSRFHLVSRKPPALDKPPAFCGALRSRLGGASLTDLRQHGAERIVELTFRPPARLAGELERILLVHVLIEPHSRLLLVVREKSADDDTIVQRLPPAATRDSEEAPGRPYRPPSLPPVGSGEPAREPGSRGGARSAEGRRPVRSADIEARLGGRERDERLERRRAELVGRVRREIKRRATALAKVRADAERVGRREEDRVRGELLKGVIGGLRRGATRVEVVDYYDEDMPRIEIELDPRLTPQENVERYFKRYRKAERAVPHIERRLATLSSEHAALATLLERLHGAEREEDLEQLESEARKVLRPPRARAGRASGEVGASGFRTFRSRDGVEVLVGRSARDNDRLTTRVARGADYFLHVSGAAGAHVIIRLEKGRSLPQETLLDAAQLALWYSLPERARRLEGDRPSAEVDYTPVKFVRKQKGDRPGRVHLVTHRTVRVKLEPERIERLLGG